MKRGKNCGSITVFNDKRALIYEPDERGVICAVRVVPLDGQFLFECCGNYDKRQKPVTHYLLAASKKEAESEYENLFGWRPWSVRVIPPGDEAEAILTDIKKMPI